jgi:nucleoside-diphosphate-sugar epimerase
VKRAIILGGTGQIGRAAAKRLSEEGWAVTLTSRAAPSGPDDLADVHHIQTNRDEPGAIAKAIGKGADLLIDCIAFDASHADQLIAFQGDIGKICAISSASVYCDAAGLTIDEAMANGFPEMPVPITEAQPIVAAGDASYSTRKVAMEHTLLQQAKIPVAILRPCAIYGPHSNHAREWFFVKRLLDGQREIPVAYEGRSQFQTTSVDSIANAIMAFATGPTPQIMNVADPAAPSVTEIGQAIMQTMDVSAEIIGLPDQGYPPRAGITPWSIPRPIIVAGSDAFAPAGRYEDVVGPAIEWLIRAMHNRRWEDVLPALAAYPYDMFDYERDARVIAALRSD